MAAAMIEIINPTGAGGTEQRELAPRRLRDLDSVRVGLLDNNKPNADKFLAHLGNLLEKRYPSIELVTKRKMTRIEADDLRQFAERCDVVVNAFAD